MKIRRVFFFVSVLFAAGCGSSSTAVDIRSTVKVNILGAYHMTLYIKQVAVNNEKEVIVDSTFIERGIDSFTFHLPKGQQRLYNFSIAGSGINVPFINDADSIGIIYNYPTRKYSFINSPASTQLKNFYDDQVTLAKEGQRIRAYIDAHGKAGNNALRDSMARLGVINAIFFNRYKNFADTVKSPAAFLAIYDAVDFGDDVEAQKKFIIANAARFAGYQPIQTLAKNSLDYINAIEHPYKVGDTLPELKLPDEFGLEFSTGSLKDKYVLINIWSTLCDECRQNAEAALTATRQLPADKFEAVSIAVDDQKTEWQNIIKKNRYNWPQLIDIEMWNGPAFKTLRFNAIPYNFIVGPGGKLVAKNVRADSIVTVLQKLIH